VAAAIRLATQETKASPLALAGAGDFGSRVTRLLSELFPASYEVATDDLDCAFAKDAAAVVVAVSRSSQGLCRRADELAYEHAKPLLPIVMEHPVLRVGPLVRPPSGPCFGCYRARRRQHDTGYSASAVFDAAYDSDASLEPAGYMPHHARLAAAVAGRFLAGRETGLVFAFDVLLSHGGVYPVITCHDCDREHGAGDPDKPLDLARVVAQLASARGLTKTVVPE
jgi:hypothetical protein